MFGCTGYKVIVIVIPFSANSIFYYLFIIILAKFQNTIVTTYIFAVIIVIKNWRNTFYSLSSVGNGYIIDK